MADLMSPKDFVQDLKSIFKRADKFIKTGSVDTPKLPKVNTGPRTFNIHKRSLPPGLDEIVIFGCETEAEALNLIEKAVNREGFKIFAPKLFINEEKESKTYIFYEPVPSDASPEERSIFFNKKPITKGE